MTAALMIIDMQRAIDDPFWSREGPRNHNNAEIAALRLIDSWRASRLPIYHVRHDSVEPHSTYRPGQPTHDFKAGFEPREGEDLIAKNTGSAFAGTRLEQLLRTREQFQLVIAGVITNNSVETTVRHAATLGFQVTLAEDACFTFARRDWDGMLRSAEEVHAMSLANLDDEYCRVSTSADILAEVGSPQPILPYFERPASVLEWDDRAPGAAAHAGHLIQGAARDATVEHIGSTAVPGCPGKGIVDLLITVPEGSLERVTNGLAQIGFQPQCGRDPFPEHRPMRIGAVHYGGAIWRIHAHVIAAGSAEPQELRAFRDRLRKNAALRDAYADAKRSILARGIRDSLEYCEEKGKFISKIGLEK
jgi:nicotinamidase-related amidase/GrpB-like predicted nucleotidyltransferase (UPF0157 family)